MDAISQQSRLGLVDSVEACTLAWTGGIRDSIWKLAKTTVKTGPFTGGKRWASRFLKIFKKMGICSFGILEIGQTHC